VKGPRSGGLLLEWLVPGRSEVDGAGEKDSGQGVNLIIVENAGDPVSRGVGDPGVDAPYSVSRVPLEVGLSNLGLDSIAKKVDEGRAYGDPALGPQGIRDEELEG
jgi:hypothetical protein